jgi:membrane protease YdiL (CAAX protease family)
MARTRKGLAWPDAVIAFVLAVAGAVAVVGALRARWIPPVLANYVAHVWMAAIALGWFFLLGRRFPIGSLKRRMRPWYIAAMILIAVSVGETVASPPSAVLQIPGVASLIAQLVFLAFVVGPTEELLFRGLIQTGLRESLGSWGIVIGAVLFGFFHLINLASQPLGSTALQVLTAIVIGLAFGALYDRTRNLVGASLAHCMADSRARRSRCLPISLHARRGPFPKAFFRRILNGSGRGPGRR